MSNTPAQHNATPQGKTLGRQRDEKQPNFLLSAATPSTQACIAQSFKVSQESQLKKKGKRNKGEEAKGCEKGRCVVENHTRKREKKDKKYYKKEI